MDEAVTMFYRLGYWPNVRYPKSFNEKIAHRKLFEHDARYSLLADKWAVRDYVKQTLGQRYLNNVFQHVSDPSAIQLGDLPTLFVIRVTHDSGSTIIVDDKDAVDWRRIQEELSSRVAASYGADGHEYWYHAIDPSILVEERLLDRRYGIPLDFKVFVFHGRAEFIQVDHNRFSGHSRRLYRRPWIPLSVEYVYPVAEVLPEPKQLGQMIAVAEALGKGFDFVRVDLYAPDDEKVVFGELTFAPEGGRGRFVPRSFDWTLGERW